MWEHEVSFTMAHEVSSAHVQRYVSDGYLVVEGLVGDVERAAIIEEVARFARGDYKTVDLPGMQRASTDGATDILAVHFPHWVSTTVRSTIRHPGIVNVVTAIAGAHLAHWDGRAKCMQSMLFVKPPGLQGQAWHQDERFIPTRDRSLVGAWIALDDATIDNGCIWVLPGSHRMGYLWPTHPHGHPEEFDPSDECYGFDAEGAVPVEAAAGSVVFFNGYLLHMSKRNRTVQPRRALVNHYCNAWSLLPWAMPPASLKSTEIPTLDYRAIVPVTEDPYADRGYAAEPDWVFLRPHQAQAAQAPSRVRRAPAGGSTSEAPDEGGRGRHTHDD